jgi:hypothetical protein
MSGLLSDHKQHFQFELMNNEYEKVQTLVCLFSSIVRQNTVDSTCSTTNVTAVRMLCKAY